MRRGDVYSVELDPTEGREQRGHRPVLVVSPNDYNTVFAPLVCPIMSGGGAARDRGFAVPVSGGKTTGVVLCNQLRTLDLRARGAKRVEAIDGVVLAEVLWKLQAIVAD